MMDAYSAFALCYDSFMDNVPYDKWADFIEEFLKADKINDGLVADLGCGTGQLTRLLSKKGYELIGIDSSEDMLQQAREAGDGENILYLCQDMREFELFGTVAAVVSVCDSLNYVTDEQELVRVFSLVNNYLDKGGIFIFDLNTPYKYEQELSDGCFAEQREDMAFIWENFYDEDSHINEYALTLFLEKENGDYERYNELHYERSYSLSEIKEALSRAGLEFLGAFADYTKEEYREDMPCSRMVIAAREGHQEGKLYV